MTKSDTNKLKWVVEDVGVHANILNAKTEEPIGMGFPSKLAESLVKKHNEAIDFLIFFIKELGSKHETK